MKRPSVNTQPVLPTLKSPIPQYSDEVCGGSYHIPVEIRMPYRGKDAYSKTLDPLAPYEIGSTAITTKEASDYIDSGNFPVAYDDFLKDLSEYVSAGRVSGKNKSAIITMVNRAKRYYDDAVRLKDYYERIRIDWRKPVPWGSYSLANSPSEFEEFCKDHDITEDFEDYFKNKPDKWRLLDPITGEHVGSYADLSNPDFFPVVTVSGAAFWTCPTWTRAALHANDKEVLARLVRAAVINLRCSQEGAHTVGIYNLNRRKTGMGFISADIPEGTATREYFAGPLPGAREARVVFPEDEGGPIIEEPPPEPEIDFDEGEAPVVEEPPKPTKKKKGGGGLLLVGAVAALVLLKK